jgi:hypothetical protein
VPRRQRHREAHRAERPFDVLLPKLPEIAFVRFGAPQLDAWAARWAQNSK